MQLEIELVPYEVEKTEDGLVVKDCAGSILSNLDVQTRFTEDYEYGVVEDEQENWVWFMVKYNPETRECWFELNDLDLIAKWIDQNFYGIVEIGYEVLRGNPD